jgi:muramoyltetrapeptide carboxypeptidase LdcA involved in peptidoglycan recycling
VTTLLGKAAPPGSTIAIVTPGSPLESRAQLRRGVAWWEAHGYRVRVMLGALEQTDWHAGTPETRARDIPLTIDEPALAR